MTSKDVARSVARNTAVMMGSQVVTGALGFLFMLFLPRYLGAVDYGRLFLAISIQSMFQAVMYFGARYHLVREVARAPEETARIMVNAIAVRIPLWGLCIVAMLLFSLLVGYPAVVTVLILVLGISLLWDGAKSVLWSCFQGREMMKYPALGSVFERIFVTVVGIGVLLAGGKSVAVAVVMAAGVLVNLLVCVHYAPAILGGGRLSGVEWPAAFRLLREEFPYFILSMIGIIYFRIDAVMLSLMTPEAVVGWYGAAYRFFDLLMFFPTILNNALFPIMSRLWGKEEGTFRQTTRRSLDMMVLVGIPIVVGVFFFSPQIVALFLGSDAYGPSVPLLRILGGGVLLVYINFIAGSAIYAANLQRRWMAITGVAIGINIALNGLLIPLTQQHAGNGGLGAAIATLITEFYLMAAAFSILPRDLLRSSDATIMLKGVTAGAAMACVLGLLSQSDANWFVQLLAGGGAYIALLLFLRVIPPREVEFVRHILTFQNLKDTFVPQKGSHA